MRATARWCARPRGVLLAEDPVRDGAVLAEGGRPVGRERGERGVRTGADAALRQAEQLGELRVVAALPEEQFEDGALVGSEGGEGAHWQREGSGCD